MATVTKIEGGVIEVVYASLAADDDRLRDAFGRLTPAERERSETFSRADLRRRFVMTRAVLRDLLDRFAGPESTVVLSPRGKPALADGDVRFNLSHTDDDAIFAFTVGMEIGVDLERDREMDDFEAVAKRFFAPREWYLLSGMDAAVRRRAFFTTWTRKEAVLKMTGDGIANRMREVAVTVDPLVRPEILESPADFRSKSEVAIFDLPHLPPPFIAAVAVSAEPKEIRFAVYPG